MDDLDVTTVEQAAPEPVDETAQLVDSLNQANAVSDFILTLSRLCVIAVGGLTVLLTVHSGAPLFWVIARGGLSMLATGLLLWAANWVFLKEIKAWVDAELGTLKGQSNSHLIDKQA